MQWSLDRHEWHAGVIPGHAVKGRVAQATVRLVGTPQHALEPKTEVLTEATHGDVVPVSREPDANRSSFIEQVGHEQGECLESEALPALLPIEDQDPDLVRIAHVTNWARHRLHHAEDHVPAGNPEFDAVITPRTRGLNSTSEVVNGHVLAGDRPDGVAHRLDGGLVEPAQGHRRLLAHARAAANRRLAPGTPLSSTGPTSRKATWAAFEASTTSWLTITSPACA